MKANKKTDDADYTVKIVIVGDSGVGKTNILTRFCNNQFKENYVSTVGVDFKKKTIQVDGLKIRLQIWDTAGQERFKNVSQTHFKGAMGILIAYSITDKESFASLQGWIKQMHQNSNSDIIKFLVGCKCDLLGERKVGTDEGERIAKKYQMQFMEVSAKDGTNIAKLFDKLGQKVVDYVRTAQNNVTEDDGKRISLHKKQDIIEEKGGCRC